MCVLLLSVLGWWGSSKPAWVEDRILILPYGQAPSHSSKLRASITPPLHKHTHAPTHTHALKYTHTHMHKHMVMNTHTRNTPLSEAP